MRDKIEIPTGYEILQQHLDECLDQAANGKGKERHANGEPFDEQPIIRLNEMIGSYDGLLYQAMKKTLEAKRIHKLQGPNMAKHELYGAINYLVAACVMIDKMG